MEATWRLNESITTPEYRIANEDRTRRFVFGGNYDLPFGKGKQFGSRAGRTLDALIGGWSVNGILNPGPPISWDDRNIIYYGENLNGNKGGLDRSVFSPRSNRNCDNLNRQQRCASVKVSPWLRHY